MAYLNWERYESTWFTPGGFWGRKFDTIQYICYQDEEFRTFTRVPYSWPFEPYVVSTAMMHAPDLHDYWTGEFVWQYGSQRLYGEWWFPDPHDALTVFMEFPPYPIEYYTDKDDEESPVYVHLYERLFSAVFATEVDVIDNQPPGTGQQFDHRPYALSVSYIGNVFSAFRITDPTLLEEVNDYFVGEPDCLVILDGDKVVPAATTNTQHWHPKLCPVLTHNNSGTPEQNEVYVYDVETSEKVLIRPLNLGRARINSCEIWIDQKTNKLYGAGFGDTSIHLELLREKVEALPDFDYLVSLNHVLRTLDCGIVDKVRVYGSALTRVIEDNSWGMSICYYHRFTNVFSDAIKFADETTVPHVEYTSDVAVVHPRDIDLPAPPGGIENWTNYYISVYRRSDDPNATALYPTLWLKSNPAAGGIALTHFAGYSRNYMQYITAGHDCYALSGVYPFNADDVYWPDGHPLAT